MSRSIPLVAIVSFAGVLGCDPGPLGPAPLQNVNGPQEDAPNPNCGNGVLDDEEQCDGTDLAGASCGSMGFGAGELGCDPNTCLYEFGACEAGDICGDGIRTGAEECDGEVACGDGGIASCSSECTLIADCPAPCEEFGQWNICGPGQAQMCDFSNWEADPYSLSWGPCEEIADCDPHAPPEYDDYYNCPPDRFCEPVDGSGHWAHNAPCNTPLVLQFDEGAAIDMQPFAPDAGAAAFAAGAPGGCTAIDWPGAETPWLVRDVDGDGAITGGAELFGSGTRLDSGSYARHGFIALAQLDDNGDGVLDSSDPEFSSVMLWSDRDHDRRSTPSELTTLEAAGLTAVDLDYFRQAQCDERGNCGVERAAFHFTVDGQARTGQVVDVYPACQDDLGPVFAHGPMYPPLLRPLY